MINRNASGRRVCVKISWQASIPRKSVGATHASPAPALAMGRLAVEPGQPQRVAPTRTTGARLRGVYLYGSAARDQLTPDSDIDIAIILDEIPNRFAEHERTSKLGSDLSLEYNTLVSFFFASDSNFQGGRFAIHRDISAEGIGV